MNYKKDILRLREEGKSYNEIAEELDCSKGTISYHCGKGQKRKTEERNKKTKNTTRYRVYSKIDSFMSHNRKCSKPYAEYTPRGKEHDKIYKKIIENPVCYITGEGIDLDNRSTYSIDHIDPVCLGGGNVVTNAGLCRKEVNEMKSGVSLSEFKAWVKLINKNIENF